MWQSMSYVVLCTDGTAHFRNVTKSNLAGIAVMCLQPLHGTVPACCSAGSALWRRCTGESGVTTQARRVELVYFNAGGGHRSAALSLEAALLGCDRPWQVRRINLAEILDPADRFRQATGIAPEDYYNLRLARGWTVGLTLELKMLQAAIRLARRPLISLLRKHWLATRPDVVVSLIPNFNGAMCEALGGALPQVPYVTVLTDLADYPPDFWIEADPRQHLVCGSARALAQARAAGRTASHVHAASGMILNPRFYAGRSADQMAERERLGLSPDRPTGMVMFGGHGSPAMLQIARRLPDTQLLLICGHNQRLAARLTKLPSRAAHVVMGYVSDMPQAMQLCDFFIGKPGPGSVSEAIQQQLPVIVTRNALTLPQERYNTEWIQEHDVGLVLKSFREIAPAVQQLCSQLELFRQRTTEMRNRAVFEIPILLERILAAHVSDADRLAAPAPIAHTLRRKVRRSGIPEEARVRLSR